MSHGGHSGNSGSTERKIAVGRKWGESGFWKEVSLRLALNIRSQKVVGKQEYIVWDIYGEE